MDQIRPNSDMETLLIVKEYNETFKSKLCEMSNRVDLQFDPYLRDWIRDLIEQNETLVGAVEELENEAAVRVSMLEDKLQRTSQICDKLMQKYKDNVPIDVLNESRRNLVFLQNDVHNLVEFIKRIAQRQWSTDGLKFYTVDPSLLQDAEGAKSLISYCKSRRQSYESSIDSSRMQPNFECDCNLESNLREEELKRVKKSMTEIQDSLLVKVSEKYEENLGLRRDVQRLESEIGRLSREVRNKDISVKNLRTQVKLLKGEDLLEESDEIVEDEELRRKEDYKAKYDDLRCAMKALQNEYDAMKAKVERTGGSHDKETDERKQEREKHTREVANLNQTILELEKRLTDKVSSYTDALQEANFTIFQQRSTISNLQDALTACKTDLEELRQKSTNNLEPKCLVYLKKISQLNSVIDYLRDANLSLETKVFECMQDVAISEMWLFKHHLRFKHPDREIETVNNSSKSENELSSLLCSIINLYPKLDCTEPSEVDSLRHEMDKVINRYTPFMAKNENQNANRDLQNENENYAKEIKNLQFSYSQLQENYRKVLKLVDVLQGEIVDYRSNNENICGESRGVIDNVRRWLEHQSVINEQITQKFNDDRLLIYSLKKKVAALEGLKCKSMMREKAVAKDESCSSSVCESDIIYYNTFYGDNCLSERESF